MKSLVLALIVLMTFLVSCSFNNPPVIEGSLEPLDGQSGIVPFDVTFRWNAYDPDGDPVEYNFYFGESENDLKLMAENLETPSYSIKK